MASTLRFLDSFAHYTTAEANRKWTNFGLLGITPGAVAVGGGAALESTGFTGYLTLPTTGLYTVTAGAAYRIGQAFSNTIHVFTAPSFPAGSFGINLNHVGDGRLQVLLGTSATPITPISTFIAHLDTF